jgi:hypothetical protein
MFDQLTQGMRELEFLSRLAHATGRRSFLQWSGMTIAVAVAGCGNDDEGGDITTPAGEVDPAASTAEVPSTAPPGEAVNVTVQARDADGNPVTTGGNEVIVEATGGNQSGPITATDNGDGTYTASYNAEVIGTDTVTITIDGTPISGSPFTITIAEAVTETSLGSGDPGVLNYAFALEQLEAAFYAAVLTSPYAGMTAEETAILTDIRDHEVVHREFLRAALRENAIPDLTIDFTSVDFTSRDAVLAAARNFEDLGVAAYNGAGFLFDEPEFVTTAGKIVSVEARHSAVIRDLIEPLGTSFAGDDVVNASGLEPFLLPQAVLGTAATFITTPLDGSRLPRS